MVGDVNALVAAIAAVAAVAAVAVAAVVAAVAVVAVCAAVAVVVAVAAVAVVAAVAARAAVAPLVAAFAARMQSPQMQLPWWPSMNGSDSLHGCSQKSQRKSVACMSSGFEPGRCTHGSYERRHGEG